MAHLLKRRTTNNTYYYITEKYKGKIINRESTNIPVGLSMTEQKLNYQKALEKLKDYNSRFKEEYKYPLLLSELITKYLTEGAADKRPATLENYKNTLLLFLKHRKNRLITKYDQEDIDSFVSHQVKINSEYTAQTHKKILSTFFRTLVRWKYLKQNIAEYAKSIKLPEPEPTPFTYEDFKKLISVVNIELYKDLFIWAALSGLRLNELINLKPEHITRNLKDKLIIKVLSDKHHRTKSNKTRYVEMHPRLKEIYEKYKDREYLFMNSKNGKMHKHIVWHYTKKFIRKADLNPKYTFKSFRSTFGYWLLLNGASMEYISYQLGHSNISVTQRHYVKFMTGDYIGSVNNIKINI